MKDDATDRDIAERLLAAQRQAPAESVLQRRRLLRALGAGGALTGVGVPFSAQAGTRPHCVKSTKNYNATASAVGSLVGSVAGTTTPIAGHTCSHYTVSSNWPTTCTNGKNRTMTWDNCANPNYTGTKLRFYHVFEFSSQPANTASTYRTCADIVNNYPTSDEAHWLTAVCNANKRSPFSYTPSQVVDLYWSKNPLTGGTVTSGLNTKALTLFRDYLSDIA